jgi:GNAT superfamily N-acetyltransferase
MQTPTFIVRTASPSDVPNIHALIVALAEYERAKDRVVATEADLMRALFADHPSVYAYVAMQGERCVGFALYFISYSTWTGRQGLWLEDLFVLPECRGEGIGKALLATLAKVAVDRGYTRLEWNVLDWNEPALAFYRSLRAEPLSEWTVHRLDGEALVSLASTKL